MTGIATILLGCFASLDAQRLSVGMMGGGQGIPAVQNVDVTGYREGGNRSKQLIYGPTLEWRLSFPLSLEAEVLHRQIFGHFSGCVPTCVPTQFQIHYHQEDASGHSWEIALLAKKYLKSSAAVRPFVAAGVGERITSGISNIYTIEQSGNPVLPQTTFSATETAQSKKSTAALLGFGAEVKMKYGLAISPQLRYARWSNRPFSQAGFASSLNSVDLLLSLRLRLKR